MNTPKRIQKIVWLFAFILTSFFPAALILAAEEYAIDPAHTFAEFSIRHLVISNVKGSFPDISGVILYDDEDVTKSSVDVTLKVASINTNVKQRDDHLKSPDFFDVEKYPNITFKSSKVEKTKDGLTLSGTLTIHGVSKEVSFPFELYGTITDPWGKERIGAHAKLTINRHDFNINYHQVLDGGGLVIGNDVNIELNLEAVKK